LASISVAVTLKPSAVAPGLGVDQRRRDAEAVRSDRKAAAEHVVDRKRRRDIGPVAAQRGNKARLGTEDEEVVETGQPGNDLAGKAAAELRLGH